MTIIALFQNISAMIMSGLGIAAIIAAVGLFSLGAIYEVCRWSRVGQAIGGGAVMFSAAWLVQTLIPA